MHKFRQTIKAIVRRLLNPTVDERMKPERVQPPFNMPMTAQRTLHRQGEISSNWKQVTRLVALTYTKEFPDFTQATAFLNGTVAKLTEKFGEAPAVRLEDNVVTLTLGVDMPDLLTEGDFDFAQALDSAVPKATPGKRG